jgi:hypothetical protein
VTRIQRFSARARHRDFSAEASPQALLNSPFLYDLAAHLVTVKGQHERDLTRGEGRVVLPFALERKYPGAPTEWAGSSCFRRHASVEIRNGVHPLAFTCTSLSSRRR